jgi:hypothetical protein
MTTIATTLTNADKMSVINQHLKSVDYSIYNIELDLLEANAVAPDQEALTSLNSRLSTLTAKRAVIQAELDLLSE